MDNALASNLQHLDEVAFRKATELTNIYSTQNSLKDSLIIVCSTGEKIVDMAILKRINELEKEAKKIAPSSIMEAVKIGSYVKQLEEVEEALA